MLKKDMVTAIVEQVEQVDMCEVVRVYGVGCGVGYDLMISVSLKNKGRLDIQAHAMRQSWALPYYLRPNNPPYKYTGTCDYYQDRVRAYWLEGKEGITEYLSRLSKPELTNVYNDVIQGA